MIRRVRIRARLRIVDVRREDRGFRKTRILNRAVLAASGGYLIFADGDGVPRRDFVVMHRRPARAGAFGPAVV